MLRLVIIIVAGVIVLLTLSNFLITKTFYTEIKINQSPDVVWSYLVDKSTYKDWNVILTPTDDGPDDETGGGIKEGDEVAYVMTYDNSESKFSSKVVRAIPGEQLNQKGGFFGLLTYDHKYILKPVAGEGAGHEEQPQTWLIQSEIDRGIGLWFWNSDLVEPSYKKSSENLKRLIEAQNR